MGRGVKQAKEKQTWQGGRAGSKLGRGAKWARGGSAPGERGGTSREQAWLREKKGGLDER